MKAQIQHATETLDRIDAMPPGPERDELLAKVCRWLDENEVVVSKHIRGRT